MNTIDIIGQNMATEGQKQYSRTSTTPKSTTQKIEPIDINKEMNTTAENIIQDIEKLKKSVNQLQNVSDMFGRKLQFNVNEQLGKVVIKVIDPSTDKVIKEIPSAEVQDMQVRMRETIGLLFDEMI